MERQKLAVTAVLVSTTVLVGLLYLLAVSSSDTHSYALAASTDAAPMIAGIAPPSITNDSDNPIAISGTDFAAVLSGTEVITPPTIYLDGTSLGDAIWVSTTTLTTTVPMGFPAGVYTVTVTNPDGQSGSLPAGLTVQNPTPAVQGLTPVSGTYGQVTTLTITGTGFVATPTVFLDEVSCLVRYVSSTTLTTTVPGDLVPGLYNLTVSNPGPGSPQDILADIFTVYSPVPTVIAVAPDSTPNDLDAQVIITGTGFAPTSTVSLDATPLEQVTWISLTRLTALVPWGMDEGSYTLTVTNPNPGASSATLSNAFTVTQGIGVWNAGELYGGNVDKIVINPITPTTLYAIANDVGLFRSQDGGESWSFKVASVFVEDLAIDPASPNRVYRVGHPHSGGMLYRSDDEGNTWLPITATFPITQTTGRDCWVRHRLYTTPGTVYVTACGGGGDASGLIKSEDYGQTWESLMNGITDTQVVALAFHPTDSLTMYAGTANGNIFTSHDGGTSWAFASRPLENVCYIAVSPFGSHEVWVATGWLWWGDPVGVLKSATPELTEWIAVSDMGDAHIIFPPVAWGDVFSETVFIASREANNVKTINGGDTWEDFGPEGGKSALDLHPTDSDILYGSGGDGVYKTATGGKTWTSSNRGLTAIIPWSLEIVPGQPDVVFAQTNVVDILKGTEGGRAWERLPITNVSSILVDPVTTTRIYVGGSGQVYISEDGGETWGTFVSIDPPEVYTECYHTVEQLLSIPGQPGTILARIGHGGGACVVPKGSIYRSIDYGEHWERVYPVQPQESNQFSDLAYDALTSTIVYAARYGDSMLKSTDGGATWEPVGESVAVLDQVISIAVEPGSPHRVFVSTETGFGEGLYLSEDHGVSWRQADSPLNGVNIEQIVFAPSDPPVLYAGAHQGLFRSTDGAQSWQRAAGLLGYVPVYSLAAVTATDRVILYAGTTGGYVANDSMLALDIANDGGTLVDAGVYRYTTQRLTEHTYLPLVLRAYTEQHLSLKARMRNLPNQSVSRTYPVYRDGESHSSTDVSLTPQVFLVGGALFSVGAAVTGLWCKAIQVDEANRLAFNEGDIRAVKHTQNQP